MLLLRLRSRLLLRLPPSPFGQRLGVRRRRSPRLRPRTRRLGVPPEQYIASLKGQVWVLNQKKAKALHDGNTKDAESFQRQINRLWGKMKRAEDRLRQSGSRRWNAQHGVFGRRIRLLTTSRPSLSEQVLPTHLGGRCKNLRRKLTSIKKHQVSTCGWLM